MGRGVDCCVAGSRGLFSFACRRVWRGNQKDYQAAFAPRALPAEDISYFSQCAGCGASGIGFRQSPVWATERCESAHQGLVLRRGIYLQISRRRETLPFLGCVGHSNFIPEVHQRRNPGLLHLVGGAYSHHTGFHLLLFMVECYLCVLTQVVFYS